MKIASHPASHFWYRRCKVKCKMATLISSATSLRVVKPGSSPLARLAQTTPSGTWSKLSVTNQDELLGLGQHSGSMLHYCNEMPWNPKYRAIEIIGMDHGYPSLRHVRYDEMTNRFVLVADDAGLGTAHGYDHNAVNPFTGDLYHRIYRIGSDPIEVRRRLFNADSFSTIPNVAAGYQQVALGSCWWSGPFLNCGAQGCYMIFNSGDSTGGANDGRIVAFDPLANKWFYNQGARAPYFSTGATYGSLMKYSAKKNLAVYGGCNTAPKIIWRLSADGSVLRMPDPPGNARVGIQQGALINEPTTGNFLLLSEGELWELNPSDGGSWTKLGNKPSDVNNPLDGLVVSSIPDLGVVVFISQRSQVGGTFYIYKR